MQLGLIELPWWGYVLVMLGLTHITIAAVTIFLHRNQTHRALTLHPIASHLLRCWLWLTTGIVTREWVAIHRKHHATTDTAEDPHSPQVYGIWRLLSQGAELYRRESKNLATLDRYGRGTPSDWIERNLYTRHSWAGIGVMLGINLILFGPLGLTVWAVQMMWIPIFAAGVINGVGHYWGYRNFAPVDASRNILPWGILIGGEELHNNHHAYANSAKFSSRWWEFDLGWVYIRALEMLRLAKVRKVAPGICHRTEKTHCDADTLRAVVTHRYEVLARFARSLHHTAGAEIRALGASAAPGGKDIGALALAKRWLQRDPRELLDKERLVLEQVLHSSAVLRTIYSMREELTALWNRSPAPRVQLVKQLEDWCRRAEESGIAALREFSQTLRGYELLPVKVRYR